jgi:hypothetical protein
MFQRDVEFKCETEGEKAREILKKALCNAPALQSLIVCNDVMQIVVGVDISFQGSGAILKQEDENKDSH